MEGSKEYDITLSLTEDQVSKIIDSTGSKCLSKGVAMAVKRYYSNEGSIVDILEFVKEYYFVSNTPSRIKASELYSDYLEFCSDQLCDPEGRKSFYETMRSIENVYSSTSSGNALFFYGLIPKDTVEEITKADNHIEPKLSDGSGPKLPIYKDIKEFLSSMDLIPNLKRGNKMSEVYTRYCKYCLNNGYSAMSNRNLLSELEDLKVMIRISTGNQYYIYGYTLPELTEEDEEWEL